MKTSCGSVTRATTAIAVAAIALSAIVLAAALPAVAAAQEQRPSLSAGRVTGEVVVGAYAGIAGFLMGRYAGERVSDLVGVESDRRRRSVGFASGVLIAGLATAGTVYGIGSIGDQTADFDATYLGTGVGFVAALGLARVVLGPGGRPREGMSTAGRWAVANAIALLPAAGAAVGFASTRRSQ